LQALDHTELNKLLNRVKENAKREMKRERCGKMLHNVYWGVLLAIEGLMKLGPLIPAKEQKNLRKSIVEWMLPAVAHFVFLPLSLLSPFLFLIIFMFSFTSLVILC
jgi:uncharacterized membrane protein HdeD (DUF308 family)